MKLFGRSKKKQEEKKPVPIAVEYYSWYMGGHPLYPKAREVVVVLWHEGLEVKFHANKPAEIAIPYDKIIGIQNMSEEKMQASRFIMFGIAGAVWKKHYLYTVLEFTQEGNSITIVLDFGGKVEEMQQLIYQKMLESKKELSSI